MASSPSSSSLEPPSVTTDPRFRAARKLVTAGRASPAVPMFATLVEESRTKYGEDSVQSAACYYEYGNALFRAAERRRMEEEEITGGATGGGECNDAGDGDKKPAAVKGADTDAAVRSAAEAAERRAAAAAAAAASSVAAAGPSSSTDEKPPASAASVAALVEAAAAAPTATDGGEAVKGGEAGDANDEGSKTSAAAAAAGASDLKDAEGDAKANGDLEQQQQEEKEEIDDSKLALELMENTWAILDRYANDDGTVGSDKPHMVWCTEQLPRTLTGIGDVLSSLGRHADAVDAYTRSVALREEAVRRFKESSDDDGNDDTTNSLDFLRARRMLSESNILVAEELLACAPAGGDVVTTETGAVLVRAGEILDFIRGYYDKARDELQETVYLMGKIATTGVDLGLEKENVCFAAQMLGGVGNALADLEEEEQQRQQSASSGNPLKKKQKTV